MAQTTQSNAEQATDPVWINLNRVLEQMIEYYVKEPSRLDTVHIFREMGSAAAIANALRHIESNSIDSLPPQFFENPHNLSSLYKFYLKNLKISMISVSEAAPVIAQYTSNVEMIALIQALQKAHANQQAKFIYQHLQLCYLIIQHEPQNKMNATSTAMTLCGFEFQELVFGAMPMQQQLGFNMNLQKAVIAALNQQDKMDFTQSFVQMFPNTTQDAQASAPESEQESGTTLSKTDTPSDTSIETSTIKAAPVQEKLKGFFKDMKGLAEKTVADFTKKGAAAKSTVATTASTAPVQPKQPVDYKKEAIKTFKKSKRVLQEMVALTLDKELPLVETEDADTEKADILTTTEYQQKINEIIQHLQAYQTAQQENNKQEMAAKRLVCRNDQKVVNALIEDIEQELQKIIQGFQSGESIQELSDQLVVVTDQKWKPLANIKALDDQGIICPSDEFEVKFEKTLSLIAWCRQAIQSMES